MTNGRYVIISIIKVAVVCKMTWGSTLDSTSEESPGVRDCQVLNVQGYLKERCEYQGKIVYKCWNSEVYYRVLKYSFLLTEYLDKEGGRNGEIRCLNDPHVYQECGHGTVQQYSLPDSSLLCGYYLCDTTTQIFSGDLIMSGKNCNGIVQCEGAVDEAFCPDPAHSFTCSITGKIIQSSKVCDGVEDCVDQLGSSIPEDELNCNHTYGMECATPDHTTTWVHPNYMCEWGQGERHCVDGEDERGCDSGEVRECVSAYFGRRRNITRRQMCSLPVGPYPVCIDGQDQINCTDTSTALSCTVENYMSSLTYYALCNGYPVCDDKFDEDCTQVNHHCKVHKHQLCDGVRDCEGGQDEEREECKRVSSRKCERRARVRGNRELPIPLAWLGDKVSDCTDGADEAREHWKICGTPHTKVRWQTPNTACSDTFYSGSEHVAMSLLCDDRKRTLLSVEREVCGEARNIQPVWDVGVVRKDNIIHVALCVPGISLETCQVISKSLLSEGFGITHQAVSIPDRVVSCRYYFGEAYVYLSCLGRCRDAVCPLKPLIATSCPKIPGHVFTLSSSNNLTVGRAKRGTFVNDLFPCGNGNCVTQDKVCNNLNDCGDNTDEVECQNSWSCGNSGEKIIHSAVCDGTVHCVDSSDECNEMCSQRVIQNSYIRVAAWIIGISGTLLNVVVLGRNVHSTIKGRLSETARVVSALVMWVCVGDLLMGIYILSIVIVDQVLSCRQLIQWRVSATCSSLGVINVLSALLSSTAMTALSFYRVWVVVKRTPVQRQNSSNARLIIAGLSAVIVIISFSFALLPVVWNTEYFTFGLYYGDEVPLFTGIVGKEKHVQILQKYYGRLKTTASWKAIKSLVKGMFTDEYGGIDPKVVGSYGVSNVCLFQYFVRPLDDHKTFVLTSLAYLDLCFTAICANFILIAVMYRISSSRTAGSRTDDNNRKLQRKVALMILTDFLCWGPFLICACLHYYEIIDISTGYWYAAFSLVILPVNSVCNPLIYEDKLMKAVYDKGVKRLISRMRGAKGLPTTLETKRKFGRGVLSYISKKDEGTDETEL